MLLVLLARFFLSFLQYGVLSFYAVFLDHIFESCIIHIFMTAAALLHYGLHPALLRGFFGFGIPACGTPRGLLAHGGFLN